VTVSPLLLGVLDELLRSGPDVTNLLTEFMRRRDHPHPGFAACTLIDDLCFTAAGFRRRWRTSEPPGRAGWCNSADM
jgi:hypothetical protein